MATASGRLKQNTDLWSFEPGVCSHIVDYYGRCHVPVDCDNPDCNTRDIQNLNTYCHRCCNHKYILVPCGCPSEQPSYVACDQNPSPSSSSSGSSKRSHGGSSSSNSSNGGTRSSRRNLHSSRRDGSGPGVGSS